MSEILGHDIDGKPLRAGDSVILVGETIKPECRGARHTIVGPWSPSRPGEQFFVAVMGNEPRVRLCDSGFVTCRSCRRIDDRTDHQPAEQSFEQLVNGLKSGTPVTDPDLTPA